MPNSEKLQTELNEAIRIARQAGRRLAEMYGRPGDVDRKDDGSPITDADRVAAEFITGELQRSFPTYAVLNEELQDDGSRFRCPLCWVVDPLDGTKEYLKQRPEFGVLIGLLAEQQPVLGVTFNPLRDELAYAVLGQGAFLVTSEGTSRLRVSDDRDVRAVVTRSRHSAELDAMLAAIDPVEVRPLGGSLKTIEVARGAANLYLAATTSTMHLWDLCAPSVVLAEAGGQLTDVYGEPIDYGKTGTANRRGVVAASRVVADFVLSRIAAIRPSLEE
jgi:3'(2'), 5'-bisphosphate nucleotidase